MMQFEDALKFGNDTEKRIAALFLNDCCTVRIGNKNGAYDLWVWFNDTPLRIEVKCEDNHAHTGNICIETLQGTNGTSRPSGISVSESQICIHTLGDKAALYRTQPMRLHLNREVRSGRIDLMEFGGSDNGNKGYLLSISDLAGFDWFEITRIESIPRSKIIARATQ